MAICVFTFFFLVLVTILCLAYMYVCSLFCCIDIRISRAEERGGCSGRGVFFHFTVLFAIESWIPIV